MRKYRCNVVDSFGCDCYSEIIMKTLTFGTYLRQWTLVAASPRTKKEAYLWR